MELWFRCQQNYLHPLLNEIFLNETPISLPSQTRACLKKKETSILGTKRKQNMGSLFTLQNTSFLFCYESPKSWNLFFLTFCHMLPSKQVPRHSHCTHVKVNMGSCIMMQLTMSLLHDSIVKITSNEKGAHYWVLECQLANPTEETSSRDAKSALLTVCLFTTN